MDADRNGPVSARATLRLGEATVDVGGLTVLVGGQARHLPPKALAVLLQLARFPGCTVTRSELLDAVWKDSDPTPDAVSHAVKQLRLALGDDPRAPSYVETIPKVGYRLIAPVEMLDPPAPMPTARSEANTATITRTGTPALAARPGPSVGPARPGSGLRWWLLSPLPVFLVLAALAVALVWGALTLRRQAAPVEFDPLHLEVRTITAAVGREMLPDISPDGAQIAYGIEDRRTGRVRLATRALGNGQVLVLRGDEARDYAYSAWSPNGDRIAYRSSDDAGDCVIEVVAVTGGSSRRVAACWPTFVHPFAWTPDGNSLLLSGIPNPVNPMGSIRAVDLDSGIVRTLTDQRTKPAISMEPRFAPDGKLLAYRRGALPNSSLWLVDPVTGQERELAGFTGEIRGFDWLPGGQQILFSSNHDGRLGLYVVDVSSARIRALGIRDAAHPRVALRAPVAVFELIRHRTRLVRIVPDEPGSAPTPATPDSTANDIAGVMAPGRGWLAFISDRTGRQQVWVLDPGNEVMEPVSDFQEGQLQDLSWSPDESRLITLVQTSASSRIVEIEVDSRIVRPIPLPPIRIQSLVYGRDADTLHALVDRDGQWLVATLQRDEGEWRLTQTNQVGRVLRRDSVDGSVYLQEGPRGRIRQLDSGRHWYLPNLGDSLYYRDWGVHAGELWAVVIGEQDNTLVMKVPADGAAQTIIEMPMRIGGAEFRFSISSGGTLILPQRMSDDTDIGMLVLAPELLEALNR
ncbi:MAG TPA: winged helix-turn-helix domain-containing protein [Xanthomonadaceae bacterium]|nr:winged helix-turn-helix domain-containing protein [Xanthomonadaceae bacterium]